MVYLLIFVIGVFLIWIYPQKHLSVSTYDILDKKGERFFVLSDMHNNWLLPFSSLKRIIHREKPTAFFLLGDLIDRKGGYKHTKKLLDILQSQGMPIYFVRGNHENTSIQKNQLWEDLLKIGSVCLEEESIRHGDHVLSGMAYRKKAKLEADIYLCHNPVDALNSNFPGIYLAGHTHGGMVRFPFIGAIYVPDQDFFPEYQKGLYNLDDRRLIITSGIGNTFLPLRFLNPIEVIILK